MKKSNDDGGFIFLVFVVLAFMSYFALSAASAKYGVCVAQTGKKLMCLDKALER